MTTPTDTQQLIPLVIGVTGHRDLRLVDEPALRKEVASFLSELQSSLPQTPLCVLSSLADGADRLVAEVALESGVPLLAPLPAEQALYEETFLSPASVAPFRALLARASASWTVPACQDAATAPAMKVENWQYEALGIYLVSHSQILLALWDGRNSGSPGGTSDVARFALEGIPQAWLGNVHLLAAPHTAQVVQIATPRESHASDKIPRITRQVVWPSSVEAESGIPWKSAAGQAELRLNEFNRDALRYEASLAETRQQSRRNLLPDEVGASLSSTEKGLLATYATADALALRYQRRLWRRLLSTTFLALLSVVIFQLYFTLPNSQRDLIAWYVGVAAVAFAIHFLTLWQRFENKYLDYRALAEGLRVQLFWLLADLPHSVADFYLSRQQGELSWIREALRNRLLWLHRPKHLESTESSFEIIDKYWVQDQLRYFQRAAGRNARRFFLLSTLAKSMAIAGLALGVVYAYWLHNLAIEIAMIMLPISAAMLLLYIRSRKFQEQSRQFARMAMLYHRASVQLHEALRRTDFKTAKEIVFDLGQEALIENGDWVILHRDRPLEGPNVV